MTHQTQTPQPQTPDPSAPPPALTPGQIANFDTLKRAVRNRDLALVSARVRATGEPVAVLAAVTFDGQEYQIIPLAMQIPGDPYEYLADPTSPDSAVRVLLQVSF